MDKGSGELLEFCSAWVRDAVKEFMTADSFRDREWHKSTLDGTISKVVESMGLNRNKFGQGKLTPHHTGVSWNLSLRAPIMSKKELRIAARAMICMLRKLHGSIEHNFQFIDIPSTFQVGLGGWWVKELMVLRSRLQKSV